MANVRSNAEIDQIEQDLVATLVAIQHFARIRKYVAARDARRNERRLAALAEIQRKREFQRNDYRIFEILVENHRMGLPSTWPTACQD